MILQEEFHREYSLIPCMQSIHLCTLATSVFVDILFKTIARASVMHQSRVAWEELKKVMWYHSFILDSGAASWLVHGLHLVFWCSRETGELLAFDSRTSCTTKYMSLLLHGQEQDKHKLISKHEAKAMVGASTKISQCMHVWIMEVGGKSVQECFEFCYYKYYILPWFSLRNEDLCVRVLSLISCNKLRTDTWSLANISVCCTR